MKSHASRPYPGASGLSLIELMVALAIGTILLLGLVQVFAASRIAYQTAEGMSRVQENARFAVDFLQRDVRMAGHFGCVNDQAHWVKSPDALDSHFAGTGAADPTNYQVSIFGYEAANTAPDQVVTIGAAASGWNPGLPTAIAALGPLAGSDIIELRYLVGGGVPVNGLTAISGGTEVTFPAARADALTSDGVASPALFGVADCSHADVFAAASINLGGGTLTSDSTDFSTNYTTQPSGQTLLYRAESMVYYVANNVTGAPALFRARYDGTGYQAEELVEGVENLQFLYGRDDTPVIATETPPAGTITMQDVASELGADANEWRRVGMVQIGMMVRSPDPAAAAPPEGTDQQVRVLGVRFVPPASNGGIYRSSYEVSVALRNRLFGN